MAEPPYGAIFKQLGKGKVVPFLGAGASVVGRAEGVQWSPTAPFPPRGAELSELLARNAEFASVSANPADQSDLPKVSAYYEQSSGREALREELHAVLSQPSYAPGPLHQLLATVDALNLIVTTNYDTLLEHALRDAGRPFDLVIYPKDSDESGSAILHWPHGAACPTTLAPDDLEVNLETTTVIFKMHGTIDERSVPAAQFDNFVITEDDYIEFLCRMTSGTAVPKSFLRFFRDRSFLFLGYSLADWNMRVVLRNLGREFAVQGQQSRAPKHWAVQDKPSAVEQWLWGSRGVNVYDQRIETFVEKLKVATLV